MFILKKLFKNFHLGRVFYLGDVKLHFKCYLNKVKKRNIKENKDTRWNLTFVYQEKSFLSC